MNLIGLQQGLRSTFSAGAGARSSVGQGRGQEREKERSEVSETVST